MLPRVCAVVLALVLGLGACSDDEPRDGPTGPVSPGAPTPSAPPSATPAPGPVKAIAPLVDFSEMRGFRDSGGREPMYRIGADRYVALLDGALVGLDSAGETVWSSRLDFASSFHVADDLVVLVAQGLFDAFTEVISEDGSSGARPRAQVIEVRDGESGELRWRVRGFDHAEVVGRRVVLTRCASYTPTRGDVVDGNDCTLEALDVDTGRTSWTRQLAEFARVTRPGLVEQPLEEVDTGILTESGPGTDERTVIDLRTGRTLGRPYTQPLVPTESGYVVDGGRERRGDRCLWDIVGIDPQGRTAWRRQVEDDAACEGRLIKEAAGATLLARLPRGDLLLDAATGEVLAEGRPGARRLVTGTSDVVVEMTGLALRGRSLESGAILWKVPLTAERGFVLDGWVWLTEIGARVRLDDGRVQAFDDDVVYDRPTRVYGNVVRYYAIGAIGDGYASGGGYLWPLE